MNKKLNTKGFTIIEVLIVLAIAGLIMLIVFLAVPALQRNSRNTQRRNDVSNLLGGISEFQTNNNGAMPTAWASGQLTGAAGTTPAAAVLAYYTAVTFDTDAAADLALTTDTVTVNVGTTCATAGATNANSVGRAIAAQFVIEGGGGALAGQCQNS